MLKQQQNKIQNFVSKQTEKLNAAAFLFLGAILMRYSIQSTNNCRNWNKYRKNNYNYKLGKSTANHNDN